MTKRGEGNLYYEHYNVTDNTESLLYNVLLDIDNKLIYFTLFTDENSVM